MDDTYIEDPVQAPLEDPTQAPLDADTYATDGEFIEPLDTDGDQIIDGAWGFLSSIGTFAILDTDADNAVDYVEIDTDGDEVVDVIVTADGNGSWLVSLDTDQDGVLDSEITVTSEQMAAEWPEAWALIDPGADYGPDGTVTPGADDPDEPVDPVYPTVSDDGQIVGDPFQYEDVWFNQAWNGACGPAAVAQIYNLYTGEQATDLDFVNLANVTGGWLVGPDGAPGLPIETTATLLQEAGIPADVRTGDLATLEQALEADYGVLLFVDSGEIWEQDTAEDDVPDHFLLISSIDTETGIVTLSDPGNPDGNMFEAPLETVLDAWADSDNKMVVCEQSVEEFQAANGVTTTETQDVVEQPAAAALTDEPDGLADPAGPTSLLSTGDDRLDLGTVPLPDPAVSFFATHAWLAIPVAAAIAGVVARKSK